ncbi:hypothetical protein BRC83_08305 [Halobacteriales archaeon QS_1_68_17]|nr:MAG: hypothetical protein BRC83_08305 [Halobacteriales archaeon QS_1_68_17]
MVSRRRALELAIGSLAAAAGCLGDPGGNQSTTAGTTASPADENATPAVRTPGDVPEWTPDWRLSFDGRVLGLDTAGDDLLATLSGGGSAAVAAVDPATESVRWRTWYEGEPVAGSHADARPLARGKWGLTVAEDAVYLVAGRADEREWTAVRALGRDGDPHWSFRRERELGVAGTVDGRVVVTALEFFPAKGETPVSHETPASPLSTVVYGLDADDGTVDWSREFIGVADVAVAGGVYVATNDRLVGLDPDGSDRFEYESGPGERVAATGDRVFYLSGGDDRAIHGLAPGGERAWRHSLPVEELLLDGSQLYAGGDAVAAVEADGAVAWRGNEVGQWLLLDPDRDTLYARSGAMADATTAYGAGGGRRFTFAPPANDAWPAAATANALVAPAITGGNADEPFLTVYAVDADGRASAALGRDTVFDAVGREEKVYLADGRSNLLALTP